MPTVIQVFTRHIYGAPKVYVLNPEQAQAISSLTGCKTLEARHVAALEALGFTFEAVLDPKARTY